MTLQLPPALSLNDLTGGYRKTTDYNALADTETNDAQNIELTRRPSIKTRPGYLKLYNTRLGDTSGADPVKGHFQVIKSGGAIEIRSHVVACGGSLYNYTSATANSIADSLNSAGNVYWQFTQIQDPRSASDDVVVMCNGVNPVKIWNGVETSAANLSSTTSSTGVMVVKYLASMKGRIYGLGVVDSTDVDAPSRVMISGFDPATGNPRPQIWDNSFYVGGADQYGPINGAGVLNDQLVIFKRNATYKFSPGSGRLLDTSALVQMEEQIGCIAPGSIATVGGNILFLSTLGLFAFNGNSFQYISEQIELDLSDNVNKNRIEFAQGVYDRDSDRYWLSIAGSGKTYNNLIYIYDVSRKRWYPPYTGINANTLSSYKDNSGRNRIITGDHRGLLYEQSTGSADGLNVGPTGQVVSVNPNVITTDASNSFVTAGNGLRGLYFRVATGTGAGIERVILSNTSNTLTIDTLDGGVSSATINSTSFWTVGAIPALFRTKDFSFGQDNVDKKFREITIRTKQGGNYNIIVNYFIDFETVDNSTCATVSLLADGGVWDLSLWDSATWDGRPNVIRRISLRSTPAQPLQGKFFAVRFKNDRPNQPFEINGIDFISREMGRR